MDTPNYAGHVTWEENAIAIASFTGDKLLAITKTVHNIIYSNIAGDYDAYTWIKSQLNDRNGRLDMLASGGYFSGDIAEQVLGGKATVNFDMLFYISDHRMIFEAFATKSTHAINDKDRGGRTMSDPDIADHIWDKVQFSQLYHYKSALQVQQSLNPRGWKNKLDTMSAQVDKLSVSKPIRTVSEVT